jgi:thiosulfate dehydrogenase
LRQTCHPRPSGRDGKVADLKERIDGCMERSMNGRKLPRDGVEMNALVAYIKSLNDQWLATSLKLRVVLEPPALRTPARAASLPAGETVFDTRCALCHGRDGQGLWASQDRRRGFVFPALWGDDSFNNGAGMGRVLTAARFIKARMPYGRPDRASSSRDMFLASFGTRRSTSLVARTEPWRFAATPPAIR